MTVKKNFLLLDSGTVFGQHRLDEETEKNGFSIIDLYDLTKIDLSPYKCLVIDGFVDQEYLYKHKEVIHAFVNSGKILIFCGNLFLDWLPGGTNFIPKEILSHRDYKVSIKQKHPIFDGVLPEDMTYRKGVSGFFARGYHPLPPGAEVLLTLPGEVPITYIDRRSTNGVILVHVGFNLLNYTGTENTTGRIRNQLVQWVDEESDLLKAGGHVK